MPDRTPRRDPVRVALVNDHEVVVRGLHAMLQPFSDTIEVVELEVGRDVDTPVDVALCDTFSQPLVSHAGIGELVADPHIGAVAVYSWNMHPDLVARARERKVRGYLSKQLTGRELADALVRVAAGEEVVEPPLLVPENPYDPESGDWPGREEGLTQRQAEVVSLITQGLTNQQICERTYITLNTLKTYIRQAYQRMGVTTRAQAVLWGVEHGMAPLPHDMDRLDADHLEPTAE
jgi:DNA-binding NarL/FixJ family response regulator